MSHSNSSLNTYAGCQMRYKLNYIDHIKPPVPISPHLTFGTMAHDVLYKAGKLRDECNDGVVDKEAYYNIIPSEVLYNDLKETFGIKSWNTYFTRVIKQIAEYENRLIRESNERDTNVKVERELKLSRKYDFLDEPFVGIIDLLILSDNYATILDYKFSSGRKTQDDFDMNSQLPLYAKFVHEEYGIPLRNIQYGYIDIPKKDFDNPILLSKGTLSKSKSQNCSAEVYKQFVEAIHGDDDKYNCNPGGYYYDCYCELLMNKPAYLSLQWLDKEVYENVNQSLMETAMEIDRKNKEHRPYLRKFDSYSCKGCDYITICKPYLGVGDKNEN